MYVIRCSLLLGWVICACSGDTFTRHPPRSPPHLPPHPPPRQTPRRLGSPRSKWRFGPSLAWGGERKENGTKRLSNQASSARYRFSLNSLSVDADLPSTVGGLLEHTDLLQRLEDGPLDTGSGVLVVRGPVSTTVGTTVELGEGTNTDVLPQVDVSGDRGCERASGIVSGLLLPGHS